MKNFLIVVFLFISLFIYGQSPDKINYQSIVRDLSGNVIQNQPISLRISILSTSITGSVVYQETFQPTTNDFGLVNIKIGEGAAVVGTMSGVDWSSGPFFLESAVDVSGGSNYTVVSTSQFMSVPYALYANESPLDTNIVQNIVSLQTSNYLDSSAVQNLIDNSSTTNIDSSTVASWGYLDSNSIMIIINNTALDSLGIQNMIDNSINNVDSSTVSSWGYLDSITIQNLINNSVSNVDSSTVANWGYLDSNSIMVLINNNSIDSITVASWGYLDSVSIQNMINNSIVNVDSTSIANFGYVAGPHTIDTDTQIDSTGIALMGYLDSVSIRNMIDSAITSALLSSSNNSGSTFGEFRDITDSVIIGNTMVDTLRSPSDGLIIVRGKSFGSSPLPVMLLRTDTLKSFTSNAGQPISYYKIWAPNQTNAVSSMTCPVKKDWYWEIRTNVNAIIEKVYWIPIINDSNNSSTIDSTTIANLGFIAGNTDTQIDSTGIASLGFVAGSTVDTQIDSTGIANLGYVAGPHTIDTDTDTQIDSAGIANYGFVDSVTVMNMINQYSSNSSGGSGSGTGNSFIFPEGYNGTPITHFFGSGSYTVPTGKSLYVTIRYSTSGDLKINNTTVSSGTNNYGGGSLGLFLPLILNSGDILSSTSSSSSFHGFLVNENLSSITHSFGSSNYTVPADKTLYILNRYSTSGDLKINNTTVSSGTNNYGGGSAGLLLPVIVSPGDIVSSTNSSTSFNGYLADSAYFESSSSNIDSAAIAAMGFVDSVTVQNMIDSAVAASSSGSGNSSGHYVGELYGGGVVFYVDHTGENGLIVSTTDANTSGAQWSTSYNNISNCDSKINGDSNTLSILNNGNGPAALLCDSYNSGGYNDWYLPAIWEFNLLSKNAYPVMKTLEGISNSDFFQETYWTSTQGSNPVYAYIFRLVSPSTASHMISWSGKDESYAVRAIRKFTSSSGSGSGSSNGNSSGNKTLIYQTNGF